MRRIANEMIVPIDGVPYRVVVVGGPLMVRGRKVASRVRHRAKTIEVDDSIPADDRWRVAALAVAVACRGKPPARFRAIRVVGSVD